MWPNIWLSHNCVLATWTLAASSEWSQVIWLLDCWMGLDWNIHCHGHQHWCCHNATIGAIGGLCDSIRMCQCNGTKWEIIALQSQVQSEPWLGNNGDSLRTERRYLSKVLLPLDMFLANEHLFRSKKFQRFEWYWHLGRPVFVKTRVTRDNVSCLMSLPHHPLPTL